MAITILIIAILALTHPTLGSEEIDDLNAVMSRDVQVAFLAPKAERLEGEPGLDKVIIYEQFFDKSDDELITYLENIPMKKREFDIFGLGNLCVIRIIEHRVGQDEGVAVKEFYIDGSQTTISNRGSTMIGRLTKDSPVYRFLDEKIPWIWDMKGSMVRVKNYRALLLEREKPIWVER